MRHIITAVFKRAALMLLTVVSLSSCIYDKYNTVQFNIYADAIGTDGKVLPDYLIENKHIYFFVNERYFDRLVPDADGGYNVTFSLMSDSDELMRLTVYVADSMQAELLKKNYLEDPIKLYSSIITALTV